jgi:UDP-glucose 4-epimerase
MRILVTGGAGYIGSVVVEELVRVEHEVVVFDNLSQGHRAAVHSEAAFVHGDLSDVETIERTFARYRGIEAVLHFGAFAQVAESMRRPERYLRDNIVGGINLLATAVRHDVSRFVLASSADVYGAPARVPIIEPEYIAPRSPYGESLYTLERALSWYERTAGLRFAVVRCFNVAGATERCGEDHNPEIHPIPLLLQVALGQREHITLFGDDHPTPDGTCIRDYIHVVDVAQAIIQVLPVLDQHSRMYNLGSGKGYSNKEVIAMARQVTGHAIPYVVEGRRPYEPAVLIASTTQIRKELGWEPRCSILEHIIGSAWAWRRHHPNGYSS